MGRASQRKKEKRNPFLGLQKKVKRNWSANSKIVVNPAGYAKMSEVLGDFIEPYREFFFSSKEEYEMLANLGALAWNSVVTSQDERDIDKALFSIFPSEDREMHAAIKSLVMDLVERKKKYFSEENRFIVSLEVKDRKDEYFLSVASTLLSKKSEDSDSSEGREDPERQMPAD